MCSTGKICTSSISFLDSYQRGGLSPSFPDIFGSENALIPDMPEVLEAISGGAAGGGAAGMPEGLTKMEQLRWKKAQREKAQ